MDLFHPFPPVTRPPGVWIGFKQAVGEHIGGGAHHTPSHPGHPEPQISAFSQQWSQDQRVEWRWCRWSRRRWDVGGERLQAGPMGDQPAGREPLPRVPGVPGLAGLGQYIWQGRGSDLGTDMSIIALIAETQNSLLDIAISWTKHSFTVSLLLIHSNNQ